MYSDEFWMQKALDLAVRGRYTASPNPCVGCVIVKDDQLIGQGFHLRAGTAHAEINALKNACRSVEGATVYVTLEPCSHYGRTPPCAKALVEAGVSRVVAAMKDPNPLVSGKGFKILRDNGIDVRFGVLEEQAEAINLEFLWRMRNALPYIRLKQAVSLDGNIALGNGASKWITGAQARMDVQICRARSNAILTTSRTVLADDPAMTVRRSELPELVVDNYPMDELRQPDLVVLDSKASVSPKARIFEERSRRVFLVVSSTSVISRCYPDNCTVITYDGVDGELAGLCVVVDVTVYGVFSLGSNVADGTVLVYGDLPDQIICGIHDFVILNGVDAVSYTAAVHGDGKGHIGRIARFTGVDGVVDAEAFCQFKLRCIAFDRCGAFITC